MTWTGTDDKEVGDFVNPDCPDNNRGFGAFAAVDFPSSLSSSVVLAGHSGGGGGGGGRRRVGRSVGSATQSGDNGENQ